MRILGWVSTLATAYPISGSRIRTAINAHRSPYEDAGWCFFSTPKTTPRDARRSLQFSKQPGRVSNTDTEVWGISGDDVVSHRRFSARHNLSYPILSDRNNNLRRQMGVPKALGMMTGRVTYVVDPDGVIRHMFSNLLDGPAHVREAERMIRSFNS